VRFSWNTKRTATWKATTKVTLFTVEAELARARIEELKKQQEDQARQEILAQQAVEREQVDLAHKEEYCSFNVDWNSKMEETQQQHLAQMTEGQQRHEQELLAY